MQRFADLLDRLVLTPSRNGKIRLLTDHFRAVPDPDRGYALAALTGGLDFPAVKPAMLRTLIGERMDEVLFAYSYDYIGDLAETISLVWPSATEGETRPPPLSEIVETLSRLGRAEAPSVIAGLLDRLDPSARFALIKLATGGLRIGVSARLAKQALAIFGDRDVGEIEELWHGLEPPYEALFAWLEGRVGKPVSDARALFRPVMLAHPVGDGDLAKLDPADYAAEWKWDGIRVQAVCEGGVQRLYSRTGDDISGAFPDLLAEFQAEVTLDGELLVGNPRFRTGTFSDLQQRLNRKTVSKKMLAEYPVFLRCYDLLRVEGEDLRSLAFTDRRAALQKTLPALSQDRFDLSPLVDFASWEDLDARRRAPPHPVIEGVMLKRRDSTYVPGRPKGPWFKWKRDPFTVDAVLMYAQRGHGKRSSYYSDYTFGVWKGPEEAPELVPVGKAYFGFTDEELKQIDKYVRDNTIERFGPVRSVRAERGHGLVLEIAFEGLNRSTRHKSGVAMRFPRISRLRWDKPAAEADRLETLTAMLAD
ncbi:cisplatin damage response ATP-dependent DNA ligase [Nitratireductor sp. L1-7-SE]|uniref:DNA ligase (ATP) n=1 Tax=Nitratireductor rhodophyticola TaxID=2854036 RepID=A0ABS7R860_9HYPH|nr:cisplatin damage response ATP-dependent DNA ligase [Nitratireductor rhodophyticola]MBY8917131.1 cisplatin damage response ATP-dependent DNA ligase [Nitratireductor rhodophyticola]MBY8920440.1 cisplatin damage response ATP-dependent DNA ligase [Nitratireductor rhodophyticola]